MDRTICRGNIIHALEFGKLTCIENGYLVCDAYGFIEGVYDVLPERYMDVPVMDFQSSLIVPSFTDLHLHAPQYPMRGMGMDLQLLEWLNTYTFPNEARFSDTEYAREVYRKLAWELIRAGTTRVCIYSTIHRESTHILMEELECAGVTGYVGKVNMDRNSPEALLERTADSIRETIRFVAECEGRYKHIKPILTPRFTPSCTDELMQALGEIAQERGLYVQSHLSENEDEISWVKSLCPDCTQYWESYDKYGLFGEKTIMAHCVYSNARELEAIKSRGVWVAHCPDSNSNLASGIAPVRRMLEKGLHVALGSDIAGGALLSMLDVAAQAIRVSKHNWLNSHKKEPFLTAAEAFYLITSAGQEYFGAGPGFQEGNILHAVVLDDSTQLNFKQFTLEQRLERLMFLPEERNITACFSEGKRVL